MIPGIPNILGVDAQIRQSDSGQIGLNAQDRMFGEYGSDDTVVIPGGGTLTQEMVEDASVRSAMNLGSADKLVVDPKVLSAYNKITLAKERVILAGSPQDATGAELRRQWTSTGTVNVEASRFLSGKTRPATARPGGPVNTAGAAMVPGGSGTGLAAGVYRYLVTTVNEIGESSGFWGTNGGNQYCTLTAGQNNVITITAVSGAKAFNVYRTNAGGAAATARFIGRVIAPSSGNCTFTDLGNKRPGFVTGFLLDSGTMALAELAPYSRVKLAQTDLSTPEATLGF